MEPLGKIAPKLAKNPLGIIALFLVLVYGFATLLVGTSGNSLTPDQKTLFVWFLILFPVLVLFVFLWLVTKHHTKLYAPADFTDESHFVKLQDKNEQEIINSYANTLGKQIEDARSRIANLEEHGQEREGEVMKANLALKDLLSDYLELKQAVDSKMRPSQQTVVSSAEASEALAEITATESPIKKNDLLRVLKITVPGVGTIEFDPQKAIKKAEGLKADRRP